MRVAAIIPTLWLRPELTERCIGSIAQSTVKEGVSVHIEYGKHGYVRTVNGMLASVDADAVMLLNDDQELYPDCIEKAITALKDKFSDTDGIIGIRQEHEGTRYAITFIGHKFCERFPNHAIFCPDYINYHNDEELFTFAQSIEKFHFCPEAVAIHHMPKDKTREAMHSTREQDKETWEKRQAQGLIWGKQFEVIRK